jgi:hypothetical protein
MESKPDAAEAAAALDAAEAARSALARGVVVPSGLLVSVGAAIALQIATTAVGLARGSALTLLAGLVMFAAVAGVQLARFRALNGVWLGGFASRVVLGTATPVSAAYAIALGAAAWAAYAERWWLLALCAAAGGAAYALVGARWMGRYRARPAAHGRGESALLLALLGAAAVAGLGLLLIGG